MGIQSGYLTVTNSPSTFGKQKKNSKNRRSAISSNTLLEEYISLRENLVGFLRSSDGWMPQSNVVGRDRLHKVPNLQPSRRTWRLGTPRLLRCRVRCACVLGRGLPTPLGKNSTL
ncbi:unnamed protein product [Ixodes persulcatus]